MERWTLKQLPIFSLTVSLLLASYPLYVLSPPASAQASADKAPADIQQFERRLFLKNYPDDELSARIERIEKRVFGEARTGTIAERSAKLQEVLRLQLDYEKKEHELMGGGTSGAGGGEHARVPSGSGAAGSVSPTAAGGSGSAHGGNTDSVSAPSAVADQAERARISVQAAREDEISAMLHDGVELYRKKHGAEALSKFSQVLRLDPHNAQAHFNLGIVKEALGNYVEALGNYSQAAQEDPANQEYTEAVAAVAAKAEKQKQTSGQHSEFKQLTVNANAAWKRGEYMTALDLYLQLDAREPNKALVKYNIGSIYMMLKDQPNALTFYKEAHKLEPSEPKYSRAYEELSDVVKKETREQERIQQQAQKDFQEAQQPAPSKKKGKQNKTALAPANQAPMQMRQQPMVQGYAPAQMQQQQPMNQGYAPAQMQQRQWPQQPMQPMPQPLQTMQQPQQQMQPMQQPLQTMQQRQQQTPALQFAPPPPQAAENTGSPYGAIGTTPIDSPFASMMAPTQSKKQQHKSRSNYGLNPSQSSQFQSTVSAMKPQNLMVSFGIKGTNNGEGVTVTSVSNRAAAGGLQKGDDIRSVDGNQISNQSEINAVLSKANTADRVKFVILRNGNLAVLEL